MCLLMMSSKSSSIGNEQTETGHFGPDTLNCFQPDLKQTHEQDNLRLRQGGMCLGNMVQTMVG